jgi:uncharacterized membrane protein (DUF106 family)
MSRTERKVADLIDSDPDIAEALETIKERSGENGGVTWGDVSDDLTSGQWGRLIQEGVIVSEDGGGFELADTDAVESALGGSPNGSSPDLDLDLDIDDDEDEPETEGWSTLDKAAGVGVLAVMASYYVTPVQNFVGNALNLLLAPVDAALPFYAVILVLAIVTGTYSSLLQANLMDTELMQSHQAKVSALREKKEEAKERGDDAALDRIQEREMEMMSDSFGMMAQQFKPMVWIMLFTIPIFVWMLWVINSGQLPAAETEVVLPMVGKRDWTDGIVGPFQVWIAWYFLCSMGFTQLIRKAIDLNTTPTT